MYRANFNQKEPTAIASLVLLLGYQVAARVYFGMSKLSGPFDSSNELYQ